MLFVRLYDFFRVRRPLFWSALALVTALLGWGASRIDVEEDISRMFPDDARMADLRDVFQRSRFVERLVIMISPADPTAEPSPDSLVVAAQEVEERIMEHLQPFVKKVSGRIGEDQLFEMVDIIQNHLPVFLDEHDFKALDSINRDDHIATVLESNYRQLISPSGVALKRIIVSDPLGYSFLVLRKLQQLQFDPNFELYNDYIVTKDRRTLLLFAEPVFDPQDTRNNTAFLEQLDGQIAALHQLHPGARVTYFGGTSVAVGNAKQLRKDSILTVSIMVVLLGVLLLGYFRKKRAPLYIIVPVAFGGLFALCTIYLLKGSVSVLALAAGSVILGIAVNYALHFLVHLSHVNDIRTTIRELSGPLTLGGATTVLAFLCLQFVNASVLRDIGLFAAFSLIGAALCTLIVLPQMITTSMLNHAKPKSSRNAVVVSPHIRRIALITVVVLTCVFFWFAGDVRFNTDISRLNFMSDDTRAAQLQLERINKSSLGMVYIVSRGNDFEHALRKNELSMSTLDRLSKTQLITRYTSPALLLVSDSLQRVRIDRWRAYWNETQRKRVSERLMREATPLRFSPKVIQNFDSLITKPFSPASEEELAPIRHAFFDNFIVDGDQGSTIISLAQAEPENKSRVIQAFQHTPSGAVDRQMLANLFVEYVHADFDFIVKITALLVFAALFISFGRIELALITFVPMFVTWIWILGIMALLNIEFNIVNVMVSTFIFGLGDDYSIFVMDGMLLQYKTGKSNMASIRTAIFISALATISGLGVLIFAQHPALRSIATISIIGIACVLIMSQLIEPYLFRALITRRTDLGRTPMTWAGILRSIFTYAYFVSGSFLVTIAGIVLRLLPFARKTCRYLLHVAISLSNRSLIYLAPNLHTRIYGLTSQTFSRPSVIIANHASFLDILLTTMLHPKLILLTNRWVWRSPVFGGVVRLADYYPVAEGAEESVSQFYDRVAEGYSIVVFPEGKRSEDGEIHRFHKGAFYLAEKLQLPIQPLLIHGASFGIAKGTFYLNEVLISLKFLDPVEAGDGSFGAGYPARTKSISKLFRSEFADFSAAVSTPAFYRYKLITNYLYKGPVLEWYTRIKTRLENNYALFDQLVPRKGRIVDLGCGYGYLCYMLQYTGPERNITGVDYDADKIDTAQHGYTRSSQLDFCHADVTTYPLAQGSYQGIVISDVLHYLKTDQQDHLIRRCIEALSDEGVLIIRDGNADLAHRHRGTRITEFFSVKLLGFNKAVNQLNFVSGKHIRELARDISCEVIDHTKFTSNVIFVLRKSKPEDRIA